jgi:hypothetical protein
VGNGYAHSDGEGGVGDAADDVVSGGGGEEGDRLRFGRFGRSRRKG